jgi:structural maintenance of chromosome 2
MYIQEIVLDGFKCYEQKTALQNLDRTFNAITGMNGSGKSNIIDAILFVLGLENSRALRASNMGELINIHRRDCRATVIFCNREKRTSPPGYEHFDEISLARTIDAEGRSKHYLNSHLCTLSTLSKLCTSMGLSAARGSFSFVVMQGHITRVLSMKSGDLRTLVEETAGTRPYEREKERALAALEKKEAKLKEAKRALESRISPFYGRLREEREAFLEARGVEERKERCMQRQKEIRKMLLRNEISSGVSRLYDGIRGYAEGTRELESVESKIAELHEVKDEVDVVWLRASIDEESLKLEETRNMKLHERLDEKKKELGMMEEARPRLQLDVLREREHVLLDSLRRAGLSYGEESAVEKLEELAALKLERSKLEFQLKATEAVPFSEDRLREIEDMQTDGGEVEELRKRHRLLRSKINYPFVSDVFGTVEENFEIADERHREAIHAILGGRAKYVIVADENVASTLLRNTERNISVIPLSKISTRYPPSETLRKIRAHGGTSAVDLLKFDSRVRKAIDFVFGNFFVFESRERARGTCFEFHVMCVTLDGTLYDPKGTLTGGRSNFKMDVVRRRDIEELEARISLLERNERQFALLRDEYETLCRNRCAHTRRKQMADQMASIEARIQALSDLCGKKVDVRGELKEVRRMIVEASREQKEIDVLVQKRRRLEQNIREAEELIRANERRAKECEEKILCYKTTLGEYELMSRTKRMSEKEAEGLEPRQKYLIKTTSKLQSRISKEGADLGKKMELLLELEPQQAFSAAVPEGLDAVASALKVDRRILSLGGGGVSDAEEQAFRRELAAVEEEIDRCQNVKKTTMDPANFDLLEKNELMVADLKEKIEKLVCDKAAITESISRFNDLGMKENAKALKHINEKLGKFLQYFVPNADARIEEIGGEHELKVKIGNWKDSLSELSGGQRSLVALCLIFSMLTYRPAPFYIFDEIDSALDLSYTQGIGEIIQREFSSAQFIVVSLKNGMFDNANSVFKVFVQEGKSRVCRIK